MTRYIGPMNDEPATEPCHGPSSTSSSCTPSPGISGSPRLRVAVIGLGAIGRDVLQALERDHPDVDAMALVRTTPPSGALPSRVPVTTSLPRLIDWRPDLVVECAGQASVAQYGPELLVHGIDFMVASVGALARSELRTSMAEAAARSGSRWIPVAGAIGALDALHAARRAGLSCVRYTGRKPPEAWKGSPAEASIDLDRVASPTVFFRGDAGTAAREYPRNANVTAAIALAGIGFEATDVQLVADPTVTANIHELRVEGAFGSFELWMENHPMPDNPRTSWLAALSVQASVGQYIDEHRRTVRRQGR